MPFNAYDGPRLHRWEPQLKRSHYGEHTMRPTHCANCGTRIDDAMIDAALEDSGLDYDELAFCCPDYTEEHGCQGGETDSAGQRMAYWRTA